MGAEPSDILERLVGLVEHENPEVQCAAVLVLGLLGVDAPPVRRALACAIRSSNDMLRGYALQGLARIGAAEAPLEDVIPMLAASPELAHRAQATLREAGARAVGPLCEAIRNKPPLRAAAIDALAGLSVPEALDALYQLAAEKDAAAARLAFAALERLVAEPPQQEEHAARIARALRKRHPKREADAVIAAVRALARAGGGEAVRALLPLAAQGPEPVRGAALRALAEMELPASEHETIFRRLRDTLEDPNFDHVVRPTLDVLHRLQYSQKQFNGLKALLKSGHRSVRAFAVRALGRLGGSAAARILLETLKDPERKVQEAAASILAGDRAYVAPLTAAFRAAATPQDAWRLGALLARHKEALDPRALRSFLRGCWQALDGKGGQFQACFEILRAAAPDLLRQEFLRRGIEKIHQRRFAEAERVLRHLDRDDLATSDTDLAQAAAMLGRAPKELGRVPSELARAFVLIARTLRREDRNVLEELARFHKALGPHSYLFLGFHLAEQPGLEREFATRLLRFVARTWRGSEAARIAERKARVEVRQP